MRRRQRGAPEAATEKAAPQCKDAAQRSGRRLPRRRRRDRPGQKAAKAFFENQFVPPALCAKARRGCLPAITSRDARLAHSAGQVPNALYKRPPDLVNLVDEADRASKPDGLTHVRQTSAGASSPIRRAPRSTRRARRARGSSCCTWKTRWRCSSCTCRARGASISPTAPRYASTTTARTATLHAIGRYLIDSGSARGR